MESKVRLLSTVSVLAHLKTEELQQLAEVGQLCHTPRFNFIFMPDEPARHVYILAKGRVKIGTFASDGREIIKDILRPGALFGDLALAGETQRSEYAQNLHDEAEYLSISVQDWQQAMSTNQCLVFACIQHLSQRLQRVEERLTKLVIKDARERIIEFITETASREGRRVGLETLIRHQLTQQDIASLTGTSRQTVTSVFNDLRKSNLIHFNRNTILIRDIAKLA
ncbi:MAG TPA: Crp/Fnr family transcriptional regulator [Saprospiraceae bacterium]|nr:Crp/Fnr family transcriptional regulator [Saprospiraceae bacterium]